MNHDSDLDLRHFQDFGDTGSLLNFVKATGRDTEKYGKALSIMAPVFEALSLGLQPAYDELKLDAMEQSVTEVANILEWMAQSSKADMQDAATEIMRRLGWKQFSGHPQTIKHDSERNN